MRVHFTILCILIYILVEKGESVDLTTTTMFEYSTNLPIAMKNLMQYANDV